MVRFSRLHVVALVLLAAAPEFSLAEPNPPHERTSAPPESRFEIIQSPLVARITLRVDKHTGQIHQLVKSSEGGWSWEEMIRLPHKAPDTITKGKVNYQILTSASAARFTFLVNVNTGATWSLLEESENKFLYWQPIANN